MEGDIKFSDNNTEKEKFSPQFLAFISVLFGLGSIFPFAALIFSIPGVIFGMMAVKRGEKLIGQIGIGLSVFFLFLWLFFIGMISSY
ncbi:MAG: hypothetical protein UR69_C0004G0053 [Candidatus Moranbacteria bacterium GW2011_GWE2_35_2-]|jgi:hypothetical protein|nr:MAG: hypothetical protein UR69_C0004G0053 [Candidatus Moranbacteria bacterium GW2011_GWE2_35_2-]KKQ22227.1 MAG: hypothetical protein US37_C0003G0053 [Candidatus Moranbacteria bacterium GW2011_GWF2_37_11]KKQ28717.1 MAG: hypothetical protein US44_C0007G0003 [Candidatus Moranbacteria bacterium GW2011_GWD1_37_17]KKQ30281.1 MAG: hypothetical protein US47_C0003G0076 [Candidatus Moranbacteria bacterium GW2011_GWE1_37_24]KKQ46925.1 MAG: hypothetical protein US66_C0024G0008 [Candidatus Moranbacteria 